MNDSVKVSLNPNCKYTKTIILTENDLSEYKKKLIRFIPVVDENKIIKSIIDLENYVGAIPVTAVIMAGGRGERLRPLTDTCPKPLLKIGDKPIIEYNVDRLKKFGVSKMVISINYLGQMLQDYLGDGSNKELNISYISEDKPLGTAGAIGLIDEFHTEYILVMNSDLLTNINFADFFNEFIHSNADMAVAATSYHVDIPYAVLEVDSNKQVTSLKEKPRYTYYSNAGIYLFKKELCDKIPKNEFYNITELMEDVVNSSKKLITFPILGYWLDIGKMPDYIKAQEDIKHLDL
jgi:NDP-sugar pyrophosphorylase family protein